MPMTALNGTPDLLTLEKCRCPGMPRSRENANAIRDALVRQASPQNSWPTVQITNTALKPAVSRAPARTANTEPTPKPFSGSEMFAESCTAKVIASSTNQPMIAE